MATCFDRWEKDPFFSAAEEVQQSADRMESLYRNWIRERRVASSSETAGNAEDFSGELLRELQAALGTAKWQLEELEKAIRSNDEACSVGDDSRARHKDFFSAIGNQISEVEISIVQRSRDDKHSKLRWVQLDEGEREELALFLSLPPLPKHAKAVASPVVELKVAESHLKMNEEGECRKVYHNPIETSLVAKKEEAIQGHRRTASASADIGSWKISVSSEDFPRRSFEQRPILPPPKIPSFSCLSKALDSTSKIKWSKNGFRKCKGGDLHQTTELIPLKNNQFSQDVNSCCGKSKNCLSSCGEEYSDKQLCGWLGAFHRQLQRSQYQIQYGRPIQTIFLVIFVLLLLVSTVIVALRAI